MQFSQKIPPYLTSLFRRCPIESPSVLAVCEQELLCFYFEKGISSLLKLPTRPQIPKIRKIKDGKKKHPPPNSQGTDVLLTQAYTKARKRERAAAQLTIRCYVHLPDGQSIHYSSNETELNCLFPVLKGLILARCQLALSLHRCFWKDPKTEWPWPRRGRMLLGRKGPTPTAHRTRSNCLLAWIFVSFSFWLW